MKIRIASVNSNDTELLYDWKASVPRVAEFIELNSNRYKIIEVNYILASEEHVLLVVEKALKS